MKDLYTKMFARRTFLEVADMDYIAARTLFRNGCYDQFLVMGQQSLEKYLKAILLFALVPSTKPTHSLSKLLDLCEKNITYFKIFDLSKDFINDMDGIDVIRYAMHPFMAERDSLLKLDHAVMDLRRYCQSDERYKIALSKVDQPKLKEFTRKSGISLSGILERVMKNQNNKLTQLRKNLIWKNLYFTPKNRKSISFLHGFWARNSGLTDNEEREYFKSVQEYVYLPKDIIDKYSLTEIKKS